MKKQLFTVVAAAALASPMFAQAQDIYVGGNLGRTELKLSGNNTSGEEKKTGYKIYAGYDFNANFGAEVGYVDLGSIKERDGNVTTKLDTSAFYAAATTTMPLNAEFSMFAKLGASRNTSKQSNNGGDFSFGKRKQTDILFGVGVNYVINKNLTAVAEYENFGKTLKFEGFAVKGDLLSIGLRYKF